MVARIHLDSADSMVRREEEILHGWEKEDTFSETHWDHWHRGCLEAYKALQATAARLVEKHCGATPETHEEAPIRAHPNFASHADDYHRRVSEGGGESGQSVAGPGS